MKRLESSNASERTGFGELLRDLRVHRGFSQLALALQAGVSSRHLCFVETGRSAPSREMVLRLAQCLDAPMRDRNQWLLAAGYAPMYAERSLDHEALTDVRAAIQRLLDCHAPYPAVAMDRHWNLVAANAATPVLLAPADPSIVALGPVNVLRMCHHPKGLAPRIVNLAEVRANHAWRLRQQLRASGDSALGRLLAELELSSEPPAAQSASAAVISPMQLRSRLGVLSFITATTVFGPVADVTLSELAIELFLPADAFTAESAAQLMAEATAEPQTA